MNKNRSESRNGSYQFEQLEGRDLEATFLQERSALRLDGFVDLVARHCPVIPAMILEVGCGQGLRSRILADTYPDASVFGLDRSSELIGKSVTHQPANLTFLKGDLYELPFEDHSIDLVYARLVFMHLTEPLKAILELKRVLRPGGTLILEDADRDCMFFEPTPNSFPNFWRKVQEGQYRLGGDPNVGRRLAPYLKQLHFTGVTIESQPIIGGKDEIEFLARTLMPSLNVYLPLEDRPEGERAIADLFEMAQNPAATFYHFWFVVSGTKPMDDAIN